MTSLTASVVSITGNIGERQRLGNCCNNRRRVWYTAHDGAWWHPCWSGPRQCVRNSDPWLQIRQGCSSRQWWASRLRYALWARSYVASESQEVACSHSLLEIKETFYITHQRDKCISFTISPGIQLRNPPCSLELQETMIAVHSDRHQLCKFGSPSQSHCGQGIVRSLCWRVDLLLT